MSWGIEERRAYNREWMRKRREEWFAGKTCVDCGSRENLQLDHADRSQKVTHKVWSWAKDRREAELTKCVARCRDCHKAKTKLERLTWSTKPKKPTLEQQQREMRARLRDKIILDRRQRRATERTMIADAYEAGAGATETAKKLGVPLRTVQRKFSHLRAKYNQVCSSPISTQ